MISIYISTYNGSCFLMEQLKSLSEQTNRSWSLVARDDGSSDDSLNILRSFRDCFSDKVKILDNNYDCIGPSASFSELISHAKTPYIMLCDQDDVWCSDKISRSLSIMRSAEERYGAETPLLVHTDLTVVDRNLKLIAPSFWKYQNINPKLGMSLNRMMPQNVVTGCTVMMNLSLVQLALPIPKDAIMHDWWLALVAALFGQVVYLDEPTILYRQHSNNSVGARRWGFKQIVRLAKSSESVRESILCNIHQAQALLDRYRDRMPPEKRTIVEAYARLPFMSKDARVRTMFKYRFFKHGMIRNIGFLTNLLMLIVPPHENRSLSPHPQRRRHCPTLSRSTDGADIVRMRPFGHRFRLSDDTEISLRPRAFASTLFRAMLSTTAPPANSPSNSLLTPISSSS